MAAGSLVEGLPKPIAEALAPLLLQQEVTNFFYAEAELLDEGRYEDWLDLLTEDVGYSMPLRLNVSVEDVADRSTTVPGSEVCWFDDGKEVLRKRVTQLRTGIHWAEEPLSRVSHLVTNVRIVAVEGPEVTASCRFLVYRNRVADETDFFVGRRHDTLRRTPDGWKICGRKLLLDQNVLLAKNLTLLF